MALKEQQVKLNEKLRGHDAYYGVTGNSRKLNELRWQTVAQMACTAQPQQKAELAAVRLHVVSVPANPCESHPLPNVNESAT